MKTVSITEVPATAKHLYVINKTTTDLSVTVQDEDGVSRLLRIARASIPQDVAEIMEAKVLKKSASFKRALSKGAIVIISDKDAEALLSTSDAKVELAALKRKLSRIPRELMVETKEEVTPLEAISGGAGESSEESTIRAEVKDLAVDEDESADDKLARLVTLHRESPLTREEVTWLLSRLPSDTGEYNEVLDWLRSKV